MWNYNNPQYRLHITSTIDCLKYLFLILASLIFFSFSAVIAQKKQLSADFNYQSCNKTIEYRVGFVDPAFDLSREKFKKSVHTAVKLWNEAAGERLITYHEDGKIPIKLIYSDQQRLVEDIKNLRNEIEKRSAHHDSLKRRVDKKKAQCSEKSRELESKANHLTNLVNRYNQRVKTLNQQGNISESEQAELEEQQKKLENMETELRNKKRRVEDVCNETERMVADLNSRKEILNSDISVYNEKNEKLKEFKRGVYAKEGEIEKIEIYHYDSDDGLVLTLAHELGHALGLKHSDEPRSIMYYRRTEQNGDSVALSKNDIQAIRSKCGK